MKNIFGVLLCFAISLPAWFAGMAFPLAGGPVIAILAGIIISLMAPNLLKKQFGKGFVLGDGVKFTSKKLLQYSVVLIGFQMNLYSILNAGPISLLILCLVFLTAFTVAFFAGRALGVSGNTGVLIGVGTAICGGSAIAAVAPVIRAEDEDVTRAISTIFLFNVIAIFIFPVLGRLISMSDIHFGIWAGTAVNDTSSVVAAGAAWSNAAGNNTALSYATIVKLTRTLMIVPVTLVLAVYTAKKAKTSQTETFKLSKVFPWFVLFFIAAALAKTFLAIPAEISAFLVQVGKFGITMAMSAVGLNTNHRNLFASGAKPLLLGGVCWAAVALVSLTVLRAAG